MIISVTSLKGGVGKSTVSQNLAVCFVHTGYSVCIVDTDTNQNSMKWYGRRANELPAITVVGITEEAAMQKALLELRTRYHIIIIDGKPSIEAMVTRIILSGDLLLVPIKPGVQDLEALNIFIERLKQANSYRPNGDVPTFFILNEFDGRTHLHNRILTELTQHYDLPVLKSTLGSRVAFGEANLTGIGVFEYTDPMAKHEIIKLVNEVIQNAHKAGLLK